MKLSHACVIPLVLLSLNPATLKADSLTDDERSLIQAGIQLYAECLQRKSAAAPIVTEDDVGALSRSCSEERKLLQEAAPGRGIEVKIDDKMKDKVRSRG